MMGRKLHPIHELFQIHQSGREMREHWHVGECRGRVVVKVVTPVEHEVIVVVPFHNGAPGRVAGEPELVPHGCTEEGKPGLAHRVEELP